MARPGDSFKIALKSPHVDWGTTRYTTSRNPRENEAYIPIPARDAYRLGLKNKKGAGDRDAFGVTLFYCRSKDGFFNGVLRAQGNQGGDPCYAKQFSADHDLAALAYWFQHVGAQIGDEVLVTWLTETEIEIELL